jgi:hypothetical protein
VEGRTRTETIHFRQPFRLKSIPDPMPAGAYVMQVEEELIQGLSFPAWRRTSVTITRQGVSAGRLIQSFSVVPAELEVAIAADAGPKA